jgi:hypothetical protein
MEGTQSGSGQIHITGLPLCFFGALLFQTPRIEAATYRYVNFFSPFSFVDSNRIEASGSTTMVFQLTSVAQLQVWTGKAALERLPTEKGGRIDLLISPIHPVFLKVFCHIFLAFQFSNQTH